MTEDLQALFRAAIHVAKRRDQLLMTTATRPLLKRYRK